MASFKPRPQALLGTGRLRSEIEIAPRIPLPVSEATVDCAVYSEGIRLPGKYTYAAALEKVHAIEATGQAAFVWIGLHEPDDHQMKSVAQVYDLHPLAVEDAVHAHQRPKVERYDDTLFLEMGIWRHWSVG